MISTWGIGLEASEKRAREIYRNIGRIPCPFFNDEPVSFSSHRFDHMVRDKDRRLRPTSQRLIRLRLIEYAEALVKNQDGKVTVELRDEYEIERTVNRHGKKILEKRKAKSWGFVSEIEGSRVKLVIGQLEGGRKQFVSIMTDDFKLHPDDQPKNLA